MKILQSKYGHYVRENRNEIIRFGAIGSIGFTVNFIGLWLLHGRWQMNLVPAQIISTEAAIISNFSFHHNWTFKGYRTSSLGSRLLKFHAAAASGVIISSSILWVTSGIFGVNYLLALALGASVAMIWNYLVSRHLVWSKDS